MSADRDVLPVRCRKVDLPEKSIRGANKSTHHSILQQFASKLETTSCFLPCRMKLSKPLYGYLGAPLLLRV